MNRARHTVTVRVPASTSNCGAGFDSLGLALQLYNRVTITGAEELGSHPARPADERAGAMVAQAAGAPGRFRNVHAVARDGVVRTFGRRRPFARRP